MQGRSITIQLPAILAAPVLTGVAIAALAAGLMLGGVGPAFAAYQGSGALAVTKGGTGVTSIAALETALTNTPKLNAGNAFSVDGNSFGSGTGIQTAAAVNVAGAYTQTTTATRAAFAGYAKNTPAGASSSTVIGARSRAENASQNHTATIGLAGASADFVAGSSGTVTGATGFYAPAPSSGGATVTNAYGAYIAARGLGTNRWGVYVDTDPVSAGGYYIGGSSGVRWTKGTGSPEGAVVGAVGDLYSRTDGGSATTLYAKEADGGLNTGWVAK